MSIQDPTYGQLYYKAIKSDPTGLIAQCIYCKLPQENNLPLPSAFATTASPPSRQYSSMPQSSTFPNQSSSQRPPPSTYPNSVPLRNMRSNNVPPSRLSF